MSEAPKTEQLSGAARAAAVQDIFRRIAPRYDLMNRVMTFGMDRRWRRFVVRQARLPEGGKLLDIATGTGDLAFEALRQVPGLTVIGADFVPTIMQVGRRRPSGERVRWIAADALNLPFATETFDAITHGFLVRNVIDIQRALAEQWRVLKRGGYVVCLDTTPPPPNLLRPILRFYLQKMIPLIGTLLTGQRDAYTYLPNSTIGFKTPQELAALFEAAGFVDVSYRRFMLNTIAVHWAQKPR
ncbi:MAG: ubiquinone biosynthesis protein [Candidatus Thermofonsia Clade 1 bacterium]|jgi:demethylmenaquinone methyltransferase/2-methoxy-6-polyprenyl-1,4-benzoquinol methylase|uniref:Demethylmenaquinone methyltransferase n=1 Tax=Candidatus Thermofonsia Clade 1 bacterium TaxID=2364210 RepID=A0A2M8PDD1_9CHLR|nr:MAG: ubiquinone biosynthesis protein [Candidatus Thermofonsia Clade 1 bacterium]RMF50973.1 MAG: ubiquinone/menaquinone biosynthesis methyltransferase [Chloroflexota bacterium]